MPILVVIALAAISFNFGSATHNVKWLGREVHCLAMTHKKCDKVQQQPHFIILQLPDDGSQPDPGANITLTQQGI